MDPWKELEQCEKDRNSALYARDAFVADLRFEEASAARDEADAQCGRIKAIRARMAACYEACDGIEDPKSAIASARATLEMCRHFFHLNEYDVLRDKCAMALSALTGASLAALINSLDECD